MPTAAGKPRSQPVEVIRTSLPGHQLTIKDDAVPEECGRQLVELGGHSPQLCDPTAFKVEVIIDIGEYPPAVELRLEGPRG